MLTELRIESLGAISVATAEFDRGFTVLTGETGTGKTMVVTGLHLLGGARADATRVRSGADRAVVEGRFTTTDLDDATVAGLQAVLDSSGAERDEDGSVIALRSISRDGPSRAYLGGRGVPAKSLSGFTNELLTLHGQNDQLRLMRPDEQRGALDRFAAAGEAVQRYRKLRDAWLTARRDLVDRRNRARELAQEADRLKFALNEIDTVDPQPGEDVALVADIARLSELDTLREAATTARATLCGTPDADAFDRGAVDSLGRARAALQSSDDAALRGLAEQVGEALTVVVDAVAELGAYRPICTAAQPPTPASISSNTIVVPAACFREVASTTSRDNITRDSSPPDALLASGSTVIPRCATKPNSTASTPSAPARANSPDARAKATGSPWSASSVVTPMVNSASAIARADSSALTSLASRLAAFRRIVLRSTAAWPNSWASSPVRRSSAASPSSETSS